MLFQVAGEFPTSSVVLCFHMLQCGPIRMQASHDEGIYLHQFCQPPLHSYLNALGKCES
jgi:hypothetical protein